MPYERTGYAPWSLTREAGVQSATVDGTVKVPQYIQPVLSTGFVDEKGNWKGTKSSDEEFIGFQKDLSVANGAAIYAPSETEEGKWPLDMTGFSDLFIAIRVTNGGNFGVKAVMGPDTLRFANLSPVNAAAALRGNRAGVDSGSMNDIISDGNDSMTVNVWNIFRIAEVLKDQKLLQFEINNNSGGSSDIEFAFMRLV